MRLRWRVIIKVWNHSPGPGFHERRTNPAYTCTTWFDTEPTWGNVEDVLLGVMSKDPYRKDCYYGEAVREQVMHTGRSVFVPA